MFEPQPLWKKIRARYDNDIKSQKLSCYPQNHMYGRHLVVPFMKNLRQRWLHLLLERGPHYQPDHQQIPEQHRRLTNTVSSGTFVFREKSARDQGYSHDELHDKVEICPEGGTGPEKALHWKEGNSTHPLYPQIRDSQ